MLSEEGRERRLLRRQSKLAVFKVGIPLCDRMINMYIITVSTTKFWCLLQQHFSTHVGHLHLNTYKSSQRQYILLSLNFYKTMHNAFTCFYMYLARK
jgi:hypothetical protein